MTSIVALVRTRALRNGLIMAFVALVTLGAWSVSSPAGSSPDEDFHAASIWCGWGENSSTCTPGDSADTRSLPFNPSLASCYAFDPAKSAQCQPIFTDSGKRTTVDRGNFVGLYPPVYYAAMRVFVGDDYATSVLRMRLVNSVLAVGLIGLLALLVPARLRRPLTWGFLGSTVPLGLFVLGSINPSGWAVLSAGTLWISFYAAYEAVGRRRTALMLFTLVVAVMGAGSRGDACLYSCLAVVIVFVLRWGTLRRHLPVTLLGGLVVAIAAGFFLSSSQATVAAGGIPAGDQTLSTASPLGLAMHNLLNLPFLVTGGFGSWGLGWLDTYTAPVVFQAALVAFVGIGFLGLSRAWPRKSVAVVLVGGALLSFPFVVLQQSQQLVGQAVQPRYLLPLVVMLLGVSLLPSPEEGAADLRLTHLQRIGLVAALTIAQSVALYTNIRRYVTGSDVERFDLDTGREWWWGGPLGPMEVWVVGSVAFAALCVMILSMRPPVPESSEEPNGKHVQV